MKPDPFVSPSWQEQAACRGVPDPDIFFPKIGPAPAAKAICAGCPVAVDCLNFALAQPIDPSGIWGNTNREERKELRRGRPRHRKPINHGTEGGAAAHRRRGEKPCAACLQAGAL